jgi:uncharacterized membrane protein SpoIIM required for sporulation/ABC-type transport system involved in multi-copper enzyme maturation permease subunit
LKVLAHALIITRRELRDSLRDWRIVTPILLLTLIFPWLMTVASQVAANVAVAWSVGENAKIIMGRLVPFSLMIVGFFPISFSLVIALESFVGERERRSIEPLLAMPISDGELYVGKLLSSMILPLAASYLGIVLYAAGLSLTSDYVISPGMLVLILVLTTMEAVVMVAGAVVVSSQTTSVRAANLLASFIIIPMTFFLQGEAVLLFWGRYRVLWVMAGVLLLIDVALVRTGLRIFSREELLSREFDEINLPALWRTFKHLFACLPATVHLPRDGPAERVTLGRLYRRDVPQLLRLQIVPLLVTLAVMIGGLIAGGVLALRYPLPAGLIQFQGLSNLDFARDLPDVPFLPRFDVQSVFVHNLRVLGMGAVATVVSFGAVPLLLLLLPMLLVGFFATEVALLGVSPLVFLAAFILPHGVVEMPAVVLATAFSLRMGASIMAPPAGFSVGESLLLGIADLIKVFFLLVVPMLLVAAFVEVNITPVVVMWLFGG